VLHTDSFKVISTMMRQFAIAIAAVGLMPVILPAQGLDPAALMRPATDSWPSYAGDYTQRRYSTLKQINQGNIKSLALQWIGTLPTTATLGAGTDATPTIVGGVA